MRIFTGRFFIYRPIDIENEKNVYCWCGEPLEKQWCDAWARKGIPWKGEVGMFWSRPPWVSQFTDQTGFLFCLWPYWQDIKKKFIFLYRLSLAIRNRQSSFIMSIVEFDCRTYMVGQSSPRVYSLGLKIFSQNFSRSILWILPSDVITIILLSLGIIDDLYFL